MRIGIIADPWLPVPPPKYGGTEIIIDIEAQALREAGHEVRLWTLGSSTCDVERRSIYDGIVPIDIGTPEHAVRHVVEAYNDMSDFDVIHDHTCAGLIYSQNFPDLPTVTTNHGPLRSPYTEMYRALGDQVHMICISRSQAKGVPDGVVVSKIIHHGIDASKFKIGDGNGDSRGNYFVHLSRMSDDKGVREAVQLARRAGVRLKIAAKMSEPREYEYFAEFVEPLLSDEIEYVGEVGFDEKVELLGGATAFINPIQWDEPFGLVMIESLACGTPVIASRMGAAPEIVEQGFTGFICDTDEEFVSAIDAASAINRDDCRGAVEGYFSARRMAEDYVDYFAALAHARTGLLAIR